MPFLSKKLSPQTKIALIIIVVALLLFIILINGGRKSGGGEIQERAWPVAVMTAKLGKYTPNLVLHGVVETPRVTKLEASIDAYVADTLLLEGQFIKQGQLLLALDDSDVKLLVEQRKAEVAELQALIVTEVNRSEADKHSLESEKKLLQLQQNAVDRQVYLIEQKVGSEQGHDQARMLLQERQLVVTARELAVKDHKNRLKQLQARLANAQALLKKAQLDLARSQITAPFSGKVVKLHVSLGDWVQRGEILITVFDTSALEVRAQIPTQYLGVLRQAYQQGKKLMATATVDDKHIDLELVRLAGEVARGQGGVDGLFDIAKGGEFLALGRSITIYMNLPLYENTFAIPSHALYGADRVYIVRDGRMQAVKVQRLGLMQQADVADRIVIRSKTLKEGDKIITTQLPNARTGLRVTITPES